MSRLTYRKIFYDIDKNIPILLDMSFLINCNAKSWHILMDENTSHGNADFINK